MRTILIFFAAAAFAQTPSFEAATIKPSKDEAGHSGMHSRTSRIVLSGQTLKSLIAIAYHLKDTQVSGGPAWAGIERYDINAESAGASEQPQLLLMLETLLAERFQLTFHHEERIMPAYAMTVVKSGLKIKPVDGSESHSMGSKGSFDAQGVTMAKIADILARDLKTPVDDLTGADGAYTFKLEWSTAGDDVALQDAMLDAFQRQLGIKLELRKMPVDTLVIDRAEKPSEN